MKLFLLISVTLIFANAHAVTKYKCSEKNNQLSFLAIGKPAMIRIKGESKGPTCNVEISENKTTGEYVFDLTNLNTGIDLRDKHMKETYLETGKFPKATLVIKDLNLTSVESANNSPFTGELNLHGITQKVEGTFSLKSSGDEKNIEAEFSVNLEKFSIHIPSYAGISVANDVQVKLNITLSR